MLDVSEADKELLQKISKKFKAADDEHKTYRDQWDRFWRAYCNYSNWRRERGLPPGTDIPLDTMQRDWAGEDLFIPMTFSLVESIVPRICSNIPGIRVGPKGQKTQEDIEAVKFLMEQQADQVDVDLIIQDAIKSGVIFGVGINKAYWKTVKRNERFIRPGTLPTDGAPYVQDRQDRLTFDDNTAENVDIYDFLWDPSGYDLETCDYLFHRTWRSTDYCVQQIKSGQWEGVETGDVAGLIGTGSVSKKDDIWGGRREALGQSSTKSEAREHEVLEFWDRTDDTFKILLDQQAIVARDENPCWKGWTPFQRFTPTSNLKRFVGRGVVEPGEHLQYELNATRSMRLDNSNLVLQRGFAYSDGDVDPSDLILGPNVGIPTHGDPREVIFPLPIQDIPNSSYQETAEMVNDFNRTSGLDDQQQGAVSTGDSTATEAQLAYQSTSVRIALMTKRGIKQLVKPLARYWLQMNQQHIIEPREMVAPQPPRPGEADQRYLWVVVGQEQLQGEWTIDIDPESIMPTNEVQDRQDAQLAFNLFSQNPAIDQRQMTEYQLRKIGIKNPTSYLAPEEPRIPPATLDILRQAIGEAGADPEIVDFALQMADQQEQEMQAQGPGPPPSEQAAQSPPGAEQVQQP